MTPSEKEPVFQRPARRLANLTAVVTGATGGVGRGIALAMAEAGANLALVGRRLPLLHSVVHECASCEVQARAYRVELRDDCQIRRLQSQVMDDFGGVDVLVHGAGEFVRSSVAAASLADFDLQYQCNLRAPFALTQCFLPSVSARKGQIVFINSTAGLQAPACISQYAATKHGLKALADSLREEINYLGVRVVSIYLGRTATPMQARIHQLEGRVYHPEKLIQPAEVGNLVVDILSTGREAEIIDVRIRPLAKVA